MALPSDQVKRIKAMNHDDLVANAGSQDFAVVVEASLRLDRTTKFLTGVLVALTIVLVLFTAALVYYASRHCG
jgi:preprotein translocase subunit SecG